MREGSPFTIYAHPRVLTILKSNSIFNVLSDNNVKREAIGIDETFELKLPDGSASGLDVLPFAVAGKGAWYLEGTAEGGDAEGDTLGLRIGDETTGPHFFFIAACARVTPDLGQRIAGAPLVFFDGAVWRDDELIAAGLGTKTGQRMGHISMSGANGLPRSPASAFAEDFSAHQQFKPRPASRFGRAKND